MTVRAKICGVSTPEAVQAALAGGAGWLGFLVHAASPRDIAPDAAARLAAPARGPTAIVAVTVDPDDALVARITHGLAPDLIQLHGAETPARVREVAQRSGAGIIKVLAVSGPADLDRARDYDSVCDHLMFEARPPAGAALPGGSGRVMDWSLLAGRRFTRPWFLAGGLNPWNVGEAVAASGAPLVDVSSGVERGPGLKDPALITAFLDAVRRA